MKLNTLKKLFKRKYPYSPVAYLGRKTVERSLGADIIKYKKLEQQEEKAQAVTQESSKTPEEKVDG
ncbi:hypothetical protein ACFO4O_00735 [Glaciecola siphonariae]|uniref:Uncharacterized protein n=1 Tax=Glaciecola siphonariae TaxID=521012 RepID=A0ABV9LR41_9ALTE